MLCLQPLELFDFAPETFGPRAVARSPHRHGRDDVRAWLQQVPCCASCLFLAVVRGASGLIDAEGACAMKTLP
jgi:hypothetical protein